MELYHHNAERKHQRRTTDGHLKVFHCMSSCNMETGPKKNSPTRVGHKRRIIYCDSWMITGNWERKSEGAPKPILCLFSSHYNFYGSIWNRLDESFAVCSLCWCLDGNVNVYTKATLVWSFSSTDIWYLFCASPTREHRWMEFEFFLVKLSLARGIGWQIEHERFKLTFQFTCWHWEIISPEFPRAAFRNNSIMIIRDDAQRLFSAMFGSWLSKERSQKPFNSLDRQPNDRWWAFAIKALEAWKLNNDLLTENRKAERKPLWRRRKHSTIRGIKSKQRKIIR